MPSTSTVSSTISSADHASGSGNAWCASRIVITSLHRSDLDAEPVEVEDRLAQGRAHRADLGRVADEIVDLLERFLDVVLVELHVVRDGRHRRPRDPATALE